MKIKNKEDFLKLQKNLKDKSDNKIKLLVGLGTCGAAAGAKAVYDVLEKHIKDAKLDNVELKKVGCVGFCYAEPTVEVVYPDGDSVLLGFLNAENSQDIIDLHIANKSTDSKHLLEKNTLKIDNGGK